MGRDRVSTSSSRAGPSRSPLAKWFFPRVLEEVQLAKLSDHKYSATSASFLDPYMQRYWNWLVLLLPTWVAPNLITIVGLIINVFTSVLLMYYAPHGSECAPRWAYFLCGLGLFIYQSLDAIDGKQARRTGTSSPLGEMFDHGCDSISTIFVSLAACIACRLGMHPNWLFLQTLTAMALFYCSHWQTYVSGTLKFGKIDVTEAQVGIMGIHFISTVLGPEIWDTKIPLLGVDVSMSFGVLFFSLEAVAGFGYIRTVLTGGVGKNGSTVAGTSVLSPFLPIAMVIIPGFVISQKSASHIFETYPCVYLVTFGLVAAKITNKLVVAHMTKHDMTFMDSAYFGPILLFLNQYFDFFLPEVYVLWFALLWSLYDLVRYSSQVCLEICDHMGIFLFKITSRPPGAAPFPSTPPRAPNGTPSGSTGFKTPSGSPASTYRGYSSSPSSASSVSNPSPYQQPAVRQIRTQNSADGEDAANRRVTRSRRT